MTHYLAAKRDVKELLTGQGVGFGRGGTIYIYKHIYIHTLRSKHQDFCHQAWKHKAWRGFSNGPGGGDGVGFRVLGFSGV